MQPGAWPDFFSAAGQKTNFPHGLIKAGSGGRGQKIAMDIPR
jgi:hypothetical protein